MSFLESSKTKSTLSYRVTSKIHIFSPFPGAQFLKPGAIEDGTMVAQKKKTGGLGSVRSSTQISLVHAPPLLSHRLLHFNNLRTWNKLIFKKPQYQDIV